MLCYQRENGAANLRKFYLNLKSNNDCTLASNFCPPRSLHMKIGKRRREEKFYLLENDVQASACP
jgi:hypothetical protein